MIEIDGSQAGGQLLRTAVAFSALTQKPFKMTDIRGARPQPGLKTQHLEGVRAIADLCNAELKGLEIGSRELEFYPKELEGKDLEIKISTAGSIGLVLQALLILTTKIKKEIKINFDGGGSWGKWAPPVVYLERVFLPLIGQDLEITIDKDGFYPKGGAKISIVVKPSEIKEINFTEKGKLLSVNIFSIASKDLEKYEVAERQAKGALKVIEEKLNVSPFAQIKYSDTLSRGSGILVFLRTENSYMGSDLLGERGKKAEDIGKKAAKFLVKEYVKGVIDSHASDMLLPYMAIKRSGKFFSSRITYHVLSHVEVIEKFLDVKFKVDAQKNKPGMIFVR